MRWRPGPLRAPLIPEQTTLYRLVQQHAATFFAQADETTGADMPQFVKDGFVAFLGCGMLAYGFLRLRCGDGGHDKLLAFSCKRRGLCPSCGARRMSQTAAHLVDHVIGAGAGAPVGAVAAHPAALAAGRTAPAGDAGAAGGAARDHAPSARPGWAQGRGSRQRRRHADPAFWVGGQPQHTSALPGAGRRVPAQRRRCTAVRRSSGANRRSAAGGVAPDHHPIDASCSPVGR